MGNNNFIKQKVIRGIIILIARDIGIKIFSIVGQFILVKLILPQYFGSFAIILFFVSIADLLGDFGLTAAMIRERSNLNKIQLTTIFFVRLGLSITMYAILLASFPLVHVIYKGATDISFLMFVILGLSIIIKSYSEFLITFFDKKLEYNVISIIDFWGILIYFTTAILFALYKEYIWNFIFAILLKECCELIIAFYFNPWRPKIIFKLKSIKKLLSYGMYLEVGNFIAFFEENIVPIAGYHLNAMNLGYLNWSKNIADLSNTLFDNYGRAAFAGMSKVQKNISLISNAVNKSSILLNTISYAFILLVIFYSREFTSLIISASWLPAIASLQWFVLSLLFFGTSLSISHGLLAMGKSKEVTLYSGVVLIIEFILAFILLHFNGISGIAQSVFISSFIQLISYYILGNRMGLFLNLKQIFFKSGVIFILVCILSLYLNHYESGYSLFYFAIKVTTSLVTYFLLLLFIAPEVVSELKNILLQLTKKA